MEKKFNLRVSARISPNSKAAVDVISFNHISLVAKGTAEHKKFQLDKMYHPPHIDTFTQIRTKSFLRIFSEFPPTL